MLKMSDLCEVNGGQLDDRPEIGAQGDLWLSVYIGGGLMPHVI